MPSISHGIASAKQNWKQVIAILSKIESQLVIAGWSQNPVCSIS